jgi:hypothetical protein
MSKTLLKSTIGVSLSVAAGIASILAESNKYVWIMTDNPDYLSKYTNSIALACVLGTLSLVAYISACKSAYYRE